MPVQHDTLCDTNKSSRDYSCTSFTAIKCNSKLP